MTGPANESRWLPVGDYVEAYEAAAVREGWAEVAEHLPPPDHPRRLAILAELVRVDLEHRRSRGDRAKLEDYLGRFPDLFDDPDLLAEVAFEEYRLRRHEGEAPTRAEYRRRFGIDCEGWPGMSDAPTCSV